MLNFGGNAPDGANSTLQEVDLSGTVIWQMTAADLNTALAAAVTAGTCGGDGCNVSVTGTHHDLVLLPNGHLIVLAGVLNTTIVPGTTVTGDVVIDLDQNRKPVWTWNEFDHPNSLPITRQPMGWPDWTHTNAVIYSADDGNLIISIRHQNWLLKLPYNNGAGSGDAIWRLGYQGDFALVGGTDPTDWFYAQHGPSFVTTNTTGQFSLILFDNGDDRFFPSGRELWNVLINDHLSTARYRCCNSMRPRRPRRLRLIRPRRLFRSSEEMRQYSKTETSSTANRQGDQGQLGISTR